MRHRTYGGVRGRGCEASPTRFIDISKCLPIHLAVANNKLEIVKLFLEHDPKLLNKKDNFGYTPLMFAVKKKHLQL